MAFTVLGGVTGFVLGSILAQLLFGPPAARAQRRAGNTGAAFLLTTMSMFGGMAAASLAAH